MFKLHHWAPLSLLLAGCASGSGGSAADPSATGGGDLTIVDYRDTYLPKSAYFAKFEVVEGNAAILYPTRARDIEPIGPGNHRLPGLVPPFVKSQRDLFSPRATGLLNAPPSRIIEVLVLAISSDQPLNLDPFLRSPSGLRDLLVRAGATTEQSVLDEILRTAIPNPDAVVWESAIRRVRWDRR